MKQFYIILFAIGFFSCRQPVDMETAQGEWIKGTVFDKLKTIEKQFRGFDNAMIETDYRYQELYWAGQDENWEYAGYQLEKIKLTFENALERRPKRAKSAEHFLTIGLSEMKKGILSRDTALFNNHFQIFTNNCNTCHSMEKVPFFNVKIPAARRSAIRN